jgi:hypothetical protein
MATDGVKIIDGDIAHDIYTIFMDMYNYGASIEELKQKYETEKQQYSYDEEAYEIGVTAYALAFWEIGELTADMLKEVETVIAKQATVINWTEEIGEKAGKARQKELDKFWNKINQANLKIKKRKKYTKIAKLLFNKGDVLTFQYPDKTYGVTIVLSVEQQKGKCDYYFCRTTLHSRQQPQISDITNLSIIAYPAASGGLDVNMIKRLFPPKELETENMKLLMQEAINNPPKEITIPCMKTVPHKQLMNFADSFFKIDVVNLKDSRTMSFNGLATNYQEFCDRFSDFSSENERRTPPLIAKYPIGNIMK